MMVNGRGGSRDHVTARSLLEKAARKGHAGAVTALNRQGQTATGDPGNVVD